MNIRDRSLKLRLTFGAFLVAGLLACLPGAASAEPLAICPPGTGAGECGETLGVAVDRTNGDVYVGDTGNSRVSKFDVEGNFLFSFGTGQLIGGPPSVALTSMTVDANRDVYVGANGFRIAKFDSSGAFLRAWGWDVVDTGPNDDTVAPIDQFEVCVPTEGDTCKVGLQGSGEGQFDRADSILAIGPGGDVYASYHRRLPGSSEVEARIYRFSPAGALLSSTQLDTLPNLVQAMAVDSGGNIYLRVSGEPAIRKYLPGASGVTQQFGSGIGGFSLAMAPGDVLYAGEVDVFPVVAKYDVSVTTPVTRARFGYGEIGEILSSPPGGMSLAPFSNANGEVFVSGIRLPGGVPGRVVHLPQPPPGPVTAVGDPIATAVGSVRATLRARINPEGKATKYRIQYVDQKAFEEEGEDFSGPSTRETDSITMPQEDFFLHPATATIGCPDPVTEASEEGKCLKPETDYRFQVIAEHENGDRGNSPIEGEPFTTSGTIEFGEAWATDVGARSARLHGELNPSGVPASGWFEYVEESVCEDDEAELGPEHCFDRATREPDTGAGDSPLEFGAGESLAEESTVVSGLESGTAYRYRVLAENPLIEPVPSTAGTFTTFATAPEITDACANAGFRVVTGAHLPDCRAYELVSPLDKANGDIVPMYAFSNFYAVHNQSAVGGGKLTYSSLRAFGGALSAPLASQYIATRDAEAEEWSTEAISPPRGLNILAEGTTIDNEYKLFSGDLCAGWLRHDSDPPLAPGAVEGYANLYKRDNCGPGAGTYEAITTVEPPSDVAPRAYDLELQGVSGDGEHAVYRADALAGDVPGERFEVFDVLDGERRAVCILPGGSQANSSCSAGHNAAVSNNGRLRTVTHAVSEDGSRVFWSSGGALYLRQNGHGAGNECVNPVRPCTIAIAPGQYWNAAADGSAALYTSSGELRIFDVDTGTSSEPIAGQVPGVLGASEDLTRVYFASREEIGGEGESGWPNLYLYEETEGSEQISFIATLAEADAGQGKTASPLHMEPVRHTARVTPDGAHAVFTSLTPLTGADNLDAVQGEPAAQVFRYEAGSGDLDCVSCNPTGGRPLAAPYRIDPINLFSLWSAGRIATAQNQLYAERVITENGARIFFESNDPLVLADTNGALDVYQWEASGEGDCEQGGHAFNEAAGGCVTLVSTGKSPEDSRFVDASADGADVFFATAASLLPQDPGLVDIYDARVGGGFPLSSGPKPGCEGEACQSATSPPEQSTPASASFQGIGNVDEATTLRKPRCPKGKRQVKRRGKVVCLNRNDKAKQRKAKQRRRAKQRKLALKRKRADQSRRAAR